MPEPLENLRQIRLQKLQKIRDLGLNPYPQTLELSLKGWSARQKIGEARQEKLGCQVLVAGRIRGLRPHGGLTFADLSDESGQVQLSFKKDKISKINQELLDLLDIGDFIGVKGTLFVTQTKELSLEVSVFQLLTKSIRPLPPKPYGLKEVEERYRQRYVDLLINANVKEVFLKRTQIVSALRNYLNQHGFIEVETPVLQPIYGGASARPFITHHNALDSDFYLRISDELYLKRLIVGGFEKVYEFAKDFRNEGIDRQHNPEFTLLEFYWAFAEYEELMRFTEAMLGGIVKEVIGSHKVRYEQEVIDFTPPWERVTFRDLIFKEAGLNIDEVKTESGLLQFIQDKRIKLDLQGIVGYAAILDEFYKKLARPKIKAPTFLIDHPFQMRPLAKRREGMTDEVASFTLLAQGFELINAYNELNDPQDQRARWEEEMGLAKKGLAEHQVLDEDYLRALEYGLPPTAGWGLGVDRFVALLTGQRALKDVILFPTLRQKRG